MLSVAVVSVLVAMMVGGGGGVLETVIFNALHSYSSLLIGVTE